ncbi:MAG TPA: hypothetical protein VEI97_08905 [bacterium]|nr:hypothetical protein [bacterium]
MSPGLAVLIGLGILATAALLGAWLMLLAAEKNLGAGLKGLEGEARQVVLGLPPAPFDRLVPPGSRKQIPHLEDTRGPLPLALWHDLRLTQREGATIVIATHPHERAYPETTVFLSLEWGPTFEERTVTQATELVRRLYLEGRPLKVGKVWQGFQFLSTEPTRIEFRLPDDLPHTTGDAVYGDLTRLLLVHRYTIAVFRRRKDPEELARMLDLTAGLAQSLNVRLGPPPSAFGA